MKNRLLIDLLYRVVRLLSWTYRFRPAGDIPAAYRGGKDYLLAIWHQNLFGGILAQTGRRHVVIVSRSRDGDPIAYLCTKLGHMCVRGSSRKGEVDKGGKEAKDEMIVALRAGLPGAVTVDGPSGPVFQVKPGIIDMARQSGAVIIPYLPLPRSYWRFNSWDAFRLPKPFTRIDVYYGEPVVVPADLPDDAFPELQRSIALTLVQMQKRYG